MFIIKNFKNFKNVMLTLSFEKHHLPPHSYRIKFELLAIQNTSGFRLIPPSHFHVSHRPASPINLLVSNMPQVPGPRRLALFCPQVLHNSLLKSIDSHWGQHCALLYGTVLHIQLRFFWGGWIHISLKIVLQKISRTS